LDRYEAKYLIPREWVAPIREFARPYCVSAPFAKGNPPSYVATTMQLDTPDLALHRARDGEALNRFKLRIRRYGGPGESPVFMEVKRKIRGTIVKTRAKIPAAAWGKHLFESDLLHLDFETETEKEGFLDFVRLVKEIHAKPVVLVRYRREPYLGSMDHYSRVTFDSHLQYRPISSWDDWGDDGRWFNIDTSQAMNSPFPSSPVILELKALSDAPVWMLELVTHFGLVRTGFCKYSTAIWQESLFRGSPELPIHLAEVFTP
jgi:hypothetical protein